VTGVEVTTVEADSCAPCSSSSVQPSSVAPAETQRSSTQSTVSKSVPWLLVLTRSEAVVCAVYRKTTALPTSPAQLGAARPLAAGADVVSPV
jgi:hypothetical protein